MPGVSAAKAHSGVAGRRSRKPAVSTMNLSEQAVGSRACRATPLGDEEGLRCAPWVWMCTGERSARRRDNTAGACDSEAVSVVQGDAPTPGGRRPMFRTAFLVSPLALFMATSLAYWVWADQFESGASVPVALSGRSCPLPGVCGALSGDRVPRLPALAGCRAGSPLPHFHLEMGRLQDRPSHNDRSAL